MTVVEGNWSDKDIVIALVGSTGSGKSSFVEKAAGIEGLSRGSLRSSGTEEICIFKFPFPGVADSSICLVDTPGIDGEERDAYDIFNLIGIWFNKAYHKEIGLAGLLYFHSISNAQKFQKLMKPNYLKHLCQNELNNVVLTTTMWGPGESILGTLHEDELKSHWKPLIDEGLSMKRFLNDVPSAFDILRPIVQAALRRQKTIRCALLVGRSLATTAMKSLQWVSPPTEQSPVIVIIGPSGCGKSQFIACLVGKTPPGLADFYEPVSSVKVRVPNGNGSIVLVDTLGIIDDYASMRTAEYILKGVYFWLRQNYKDSKVAGLLFLQNILSENCANPPPKPTLKKVAGDDAITKLIFVSTRWDQIQYDLGIRRETRICLPLAPLLQSGARMDCFDMKIETAWRIIGSLLRQNIQEGDGITDSDDYIMPDLY